MSLNEYLSQSENTTIIYRQGVLCLETHDTLLASNKLLSDKTEALAKKLQVQEVSKMLINGVSCDFCVQARESCACLPTSLSLSEEKVKYKGVYTR